MNQHQLAALARQHQAELQHLAVGPHWPRPERAARPSLRVRTGWTMVDLGLRLAAQPRAARQPRPAGS